MEIVSSEHPPPLRCRDFTPSLTLCVQLSRWQVPYGPCYPAGQGVDVLERHSAQWPGSQNADTGNTFLPNNQEPGPKRKSVHCRRRGVPWDLLMKGMQSCPLDPDWTKPQDLKQHSSVLHFVSLSTHKAKSVRAKMRKANPQSNICLECSCFQKYHLGAANMMVGTLLSWAGWASLS